MGRRAFAGLAIAVMALGFVPASASADYPSGLPNWPAQLEANPNSSPARVRLKFEVCPKGRAACPSAVIREMKRRWRPLDRRCDHRAVFALTYLRTTQEFLRTTTADRHFFAEPHWVNHEDAVFAELYFRAYDRWVKGRPVPAAWQTAFDAARSPNLTAIGDLLLGMSAHINRDLPYALASVGIVRRGVGPRKADHDKVNQFLDRVIDPLQTELARRYDPLFGLTDAEPSPLDEIGALQAIRGFRENAWRNAERLVNAAAGPERDLVSASIEQEAQAIAQMIVAGNTVPGYGPSRDAHCRASH
jgi:hypothetical protein